MNELTHPAGTPPPWRDEELASLFEAVNNSGRWGADDELGTLNYITPAKRVEAARLVRTGETLSLSLSLPLASGTTIGRPAPVEHRMLYGHRGPPPPGAPASAGDYLGLEVHQPAVTHLDCLSHVASHDGRVYNGRRFDQVVTAAGVGHGSIYAQRGGIVTRGVLLDVPAALGLDWLDASHGVTVTELEAAERSGGVRVSSGDALVLRAGTQARAAALGRQPLAAGPAPECLPWLHQREVALYTGDAPEWITAAGARILGADAGEAGAPFPTRFPLPLHQIGLAAMGLALLDHCAVEALARTCQRLGRHAFLFVAAPLPLPGGTGSPVNPLAIF